MFKKKYNVMLIDSKWNPIKKDLKFTVIPRKDEYIYLVDRYYHVINVVHNMLLKHDILIVVEEMTRESVSIQPNKK